MCPNLIGSSVWADVELGGSWPRIVYGAKHLLSAHQHLDLLPRWHTLPTLGLLQSLADEWCVVIHLRLGTLALDPAGKSESVRKSHVCVDSREYRIARYLPRKWICLTQKMLMIVISTVLCCDYGFCIILVIHSSSLFSLGWQRTEVNEARNDKCSHLSS